ncbi:MAG TPA: SpoIID/LytB domain-containing protein [Syntrophorhabdales bacterium]|nr:SpoIID/LytB domain-containing protein [Syntrophorhabdales bacterium]
MTPPPLDPSNLAAGEPCITVGIIDRRTDITGRLDGAFAVIDHGSVSGVFSAHAERGMIVLVDKGLSEIARAPRIRLSADAGSTFTLSDVTIGNRFHWERNEDQTFHGNLILELREGGTITAINEILLEDYLKSVISSEMSAAAPMEFLKTHAILSRSWVLAALQRKKNGKERPVSINTSIEREGEVRRWYDREGHDLFDVCADDHCQRYQGLTKITSIQAEDAVRETRGMVIAYQHEICDARYSKACGGLTEDFMTAWDDKSVPYLVSVSDASVVHAPARSEEEAFRWIMSVPEAFCHTEDKGLLERILPEFDRETKGFFRWTIEYSREELEEILREKSGLDFGTLRDILPLGRGPSGRIARLRIVGSKRSMIVGKELEIRRWLSRSHLLSSAFIVTAKRNPSGEVQTFTFHGAGWGHGVGLCQIGAAVMASRGFRADEILKHYFRGVELQKLYR